MLWSSMKSFLHTIFLIIKVHLWNEPNLDSHNNLCFFLWMATTLVFSILGWWYWCFRFARKACLSTIFLIIKVNPWNETNSDTHYNLHTFCYWHYNHALHISIHDMDARKAFFSTTFLIINVHLWNKTNLDTHNNLHFFLLLGTTIMFTSLGYMILCFDLARKVFFHHFPCN